MIQTHENGGKPYLGPDHHGKARWAQIWAT